MHEWVFPSRRWHEVHLFSSAVLLVPFRHGFAIWDCSLKLAQFVQFIWYVGADSVKQLHAKSVDGMGTVFKIVEISTGTILDTCPRVGQYLWNSYIQLNNWSSEPGGGLLIIQEVCLCPCCKAAFHLTTWIVEGVCETVIPWCGKPTPYSKWFLLAFVHTWCLW